MMPAQPFDIQLNLVELLDGVVPITAPGVFANVRPTGLSLDSRQLQRGQLFFAIGGTQTSGARFIADAIYSGAVAVITDSPVDDVLMRLAQEKGVPLVYDPMLQQSLGVIASRFYGEPSRTLTMIGVTGTDGKTSMTHFIAQALSQNPSRGRCGLFGTLGYGFYGNLSEASHTTPDAITLQRLLAALRDGGADAVAMEVSSHGLDQGRVNGIAFDIAVLTNLGRDHLDYHVDIYHYKQAKRRLFAMDSLRSAVLNWHDDFAQELLEAYATAYPISVFALNVDKNVLQNSTAKDWVLGTQLVLDAGGMQMLVQVPDGEFAVSCGLLGDFNALNVLATIAVLRRLAWSQQDIVDAVSGLNSVNGRMQLTRQDNAPSVVIDYAHTPQALKAALSNLRRHCDGELWCVFGCGGDRDRGKRAEMGAIAEQLADRVVITDDNPRYEAPERIVDEILSGVRNRSGVLVFHDRAEAIQVAITGAKPGDVVLIAGKGHEQYQQIADQKIPFSDQQQVDEIMGTLR